MPIGEAERARIELTVSCRATDSIDKVEAAGRIVDGAQVMHNGVRIQAGCYYGEWMTEIIRQLGGHHEPQEEVVFRAVVERLAATTAAPVMLEAGAFWAYYSLWFLHRVPSGRTFLVEPDPNNLEAGRRNFALNDRTGTFLQAAVGAHPTGSRPFPCESDGVVREVPTESLASLLDRFEVDHIDLLLADVQGAETAFLEGAKDLLMAGAVRAVLVSTHHHSISGDPLTHQRLLAYLRSIGAHVVAEHTVAESFSGDGLIAASFDARDADLEIDVERARTSESLFGDPLYDLARVGHEVADAQKRLQDLNTLLHAEREGRRAAHEELVTLTATCTWRLRNRVLDIIERIRP